MSHTRSSYDSYRDAMKYRQLLLAIEQATRQIRLFEQESRPDIDEVMEKLLPQLAGALDWPVVVRSSSAIEDSQGFSCAGINRFPSR